MKKNLKIAVVAAAAIATTGFSACDRGGDGPDPQPVRNAVLKVTLVNPAPQTRVEGSTPSTATTITDFSLFVINSEGNVGWSTYVSGSAAASGEAYIEVTTDAKAIYAIANAGRDLHETYKNRDALEGTGPLAEDLYDQYTSRWATGMVDGADWEFQTADSNNNGLLEQRVSLPLTFIAARITVSVINKMSNYDGTADQRVQLTNVAVLNARGQSRLFPTSGGSASLIPATYSANYKYLEGIANRTPTFAYYPAAADITVEAAGTGDLNNAYTWPNSTTVPHNSYFWVFENDADEMNEFPTIVTVVGTDAGGDPVYFPVHFAAYETWASNSSNYAGGIVRGNSYNVTITLNGDASNGNGGGVDDPTQNVENVEIMATLSILPWNDITLGKNF